VASVSANAANAPINRVYRLISPSESSTTRSMVLIWKIATLGFTSETTARIAGTSAVGDNAVRTTSDMPRSDAIVTFCAAT